MKEPKISIVTPSFNQGKFIREAIDSILNQGYPNFEHIIIDNCSDDETLDILAEYPHLMVVSEPDEGQSDALNKGFLKATGEIIGWLNADDYYMPGTFHTVAKKMQDPEIAGVYSNVHFVDEQGNKRRDIISHRPSKWISLFLCFIQSTSFFYRREIVDNDILIDKHFDICMDKEFFSHILFKGYRLSYVDDFFASFRWHDTNKSLPSPAVKQKRMKEGLTIFNRYSGIQVGINALTLRLYELGIMTSKVFRLALRLSS